MKKMKWQILKGPYRSKVSKGFVYLCKCRCGLTKEIRVYEIDDRKSRSCNGCRDWKNNGTHKMSKTRTYKVWIGIIDRCYNPKSSIFKWYGGRGIKMYGPWKKNFLLFYKSVGRRPSINYSIDRIDPNKGYVPGNVRWIKKSEQNRNKRNNIFYFYKGKKMLLSDIARNIGIKETTLRSRIFQYGYTFKQAIDLNHRIWRVRPAV